MTDRPCPDAKAAEIAERLAKYGEADTFTSPSWEDVETLLADRDMADMVIRGLLEEMRARLSRKNVVMGLGWSNLAVRVAREFVGDKEGSR